MTTNATRFRKHHSLDANLDLAEHTASIDALYEVHNIATAWLKEIDNESGRDMFVVLAYINLVSRIFEQASGMLVCLATGAWPSAEALSRVVLESSVNLLCLSRTGGEESLLAFFDSWLDDHEKRLFQWRALAERDNDRENLDRIDSRSSYVQAIRRALDACVDQLSMHRAQTPRQFWPSSVYERFSLVGMEADYRSTYHRMSSASHMLAEDTLNWLLLVHMPNSEDALQAAGAEAVSYSVMLSRISLAAAIDSMVGCCLAKGMTDVSVAERHREALVRSVKEIAPLAGVPNVD